MLCPLEIEGVLRYILNGFASLFPSDFRPPKEEAKLVVDRVDDSVNGFLNKLFMKPSFGFLLPLVLVGGGMMAVREWDEAYGSLKASDVIKSIPCGYHADSLVRLSSLRFTS